MSQTEGKIPPTGVRGLRGPRIFVSAYACEPGLGSEIGVGWHWVLEMSKYFDLWVLTRESNRARIEAWFKNNNITTKGETPDSQTSAQLPPYGGYGGLHFIYFDLPKWARFWKKGLRGVRTYYNIWTRLSNPLVKKTMIENDINIFHHITYGNALWPVSKYGSSKTFIWGPIGGLETIPEEYSRHYEGKSKWIETVRRLAVKRAVMSKALRERAQKAALILCKTQDTLNLLPLKERDKAVLFTDVACEKNISNSAKSKERQNISSTLNLLAVGRLDSWRGFDLAILALTEAIKDQKSLNAHLNIVGKGDDLKRLQRIVKENALEQHVTFCGKVSKEEYQRLMETTDVVVNASLKEGAVTVSFDAMTMGKPLIALETGGYTRYFTPDYSVVIPKEDRKKTISNIAKAIIKLADPHLRMKMGEAAITASANLSWEKHGIEIRNLFERFEKQ